MRDLSGEAGTAGFRQGLGHRPGGIPDVEGPGGKVPRNGGSVPLRTAEAAVLCEQGSPGHYGGGHLRIYASLQGNPPGVKPDAQERTGGLQQLLRMAAGQGPDSEESHGPGGGDQGGAEDPQAYTDEEREMLLRNCSTLRDKAMMEFFYSTAVRVSELAALNRDDIRFTSKDLIVFGKGSKERRVYLNDRTNLYMKEYLDSRTDGSPALFVSTRRPHSRLSRRGSRTSSGGRASGRGREGPPAPVPQDVPDQCPEPGDAAAGGHGHGGPCEAGDDDGLLHGGPGRRQVSSSEVFKRIARGGIRPFFTSGEGRGVFVVRFYRRN